MFSSWLLSCKSLWIKASSKWLNVNIDNSIPKALFSALEGENTPTTAKNVQVWLIALMKPVFHATLNRTEPLLVLLVTPALFLLWLLLKMCGEKRWLSGPNSRYLIGHYWKKCLCCPVWLKLTLATRVCAFCSHMFPHFISEMQKLLMSTNQ